MRLQEVFKYSRQERRFSITSSYQTIEKSGFCSKNRTLGCPTFAKLRWERFQP
jgi:hypothetical protein